MYFHQKQKRCNLRFICNWFFLPSLPVHGSRKKCLFPHTNAPQPVLSLPDVPPGLAPPAKACSINMCSTPALAAGRQTPLASWQCPCSAPSARTPSQCCVSRRYCSYRSCIKQIICPTHKRERRAQLMQLQKFKLISSTGFIGCQWSSGSFAGRAFCVKYSAWQGELPLEIVL